MSTFYYLFISFEMQLNVINVETLEPLYLWFMRWVIFTARDPTAGVQFPIVMS